MMLQRSLSKYEVSTMRPLSWKKCNDSRLKYYRARSTSLEQTVPGNWTKLSRYFRAQTFLGMALIAQCRCGSSGSQATYRCNWMSCGTSSREAPPAAQYKGLAWWGLSKASVSRVSEHVTPVSLHNTSHLYVWWQGINANWAVLCVKYVYGENAL